MKTTVIKTVAIVLIASLVVGLCGCCNSCCSDSSNGLKLSPIYQSAICGAIIGGIVGYQSGEEGEGAAIGAALFGVGEFLNQTDKLNEERECEDEDDDDDPDEEGEEVVVIIRGKNGSIFPVELKKRDFTYIGPKGEKYEHLPTEEQLRAVYGT
ncbi:MAG: hypothetical protein ACYTFW_18105 [Planctomycetota bacterium]|jgi:hypothetical protein